MVKVVLPSPYEGHELSSDGFIKPYLSAQHNAAANMSVIKQSRGKEGLFGENEVPPRIKTTQRACSDGGELVMLFT